MSDEVIGTLNELRSSCLDSEEGFGKAAKGVHDDDLRDRFMGIARHRADFSNELAGHVRNLGGQPSESGHQSSLQQPGWYELEKGIHRREDDALLAEAERGEENTLRHYDHALTRELPPPIRTMLDRQRLAVQETLLDLRVAEELRR